MNSGWSDGRVGCIQCGSSSTITNTSIQVMDERTPLLVPGTNVTAIHNDDQQYVHRHATCVQIMFMITLSMFLIIGVGTAVYLLVSEGTDWITWSTYSLVRRVDWNANSSTEKLIPYGTPINRITLLSTKTNSCWNEDDCCEIVKNLQSYQMYTMKEPDINYNFLIGNDGQIYEGTGWKTKNRLSNIYQNETIILGIIGYGDTPILDSQTDTAQTFLDVSVNKNLISKCYTILVPYNYQIKEYFLIDLAAKLQHNVDRYCNKILLY